MWLLLLFIVVPVLEIWLFIIIGGAIGTYITLSIILLTAILGTFLVKAQGIYVLKEIQGKLNELKNKGYNVRIYVPYGPEWFEYSIRRIKENPKIVSYILKNMFKRWMKKYL